MKKYENIYTPCRCMDDGKRKYIRNANGKNRKVNIWKNKEGQTKLDKKHKIKRKMMAIRRGHHYERE